MADQIHGETILELAIKEPETVDGKQREGFIFRVVQWKKTNEAGDVENMGGPQLHKQIQFLHEESGEIRSGKQKGMRKAEWLLIKENFDKIDAILDPPESE